MTTYLRPESDLGLVHVWHDRDGKLTKASEWRADPPVGSTVEVLGGTAVVMENPDHGAHLVVDGPNGHETLDRADCGYWVAMLTGVES